MNPFELQCPKMQFPTIVEILRGLMWIYIS